MSKKKPHTYKIVPGKGLTSVDRRQNREIKKLKKDIKSLTPADNNKFLDTNMYQSISSTTQTMILNNVQPINLDGSVSSASASLSQRKGKRISIRSLHVKGVVYNPSVTLSPDDHCTVRMVIVRFPDDGATTNTGLDSCLTAQTGALDPYMFAFKDRMPKNPYEIVYDRVFNLQAAYQSAAQQYPTDKWRVNINKKIYFRGKAQDTRWGEIESVSSPSENALAVMLISDSAAVSHPAVSLNFRLHYQDN